MGKIVGGTQMLNNMIYSRGHPEDYKGWFGPPGKYNYETDILPYFKKMENFIETSASKNNLIVIS